MKKKIIITVLVLIVVVIAWFVLGRQSDIKVITQDELVATYTTEVK